jgi:hypothetical protein
VVWPPLTFVAKQRCNVLSFQSHQFVFIVLRCLRKASLQVTGTLPGLYIVVQLVRHLYLGRRYSAERDPHTSGMPLLMLYILHRLTIVFTYPFIST